LQGCSCYTELVELSLGRIQPAASQKEVVSYLTPSWTSKSCIQVEVVLLSFKVVPIIVVFTLELSPLSTQVVSKKVVNFSSCSQNSCNFSKLTQSTSELSLSKFKPVLALFQVESQKVVKFTQVVQILFSHPACHSRSKMESLKDAHVLLLLV